MSKWKFERDQQKKQLRQQSIVSQLRQKNAVISSQKIEEHMTANEIAAGAAVVKNPDAVLIDEFKNLAADLVKKELDAMYQTAFAPVRYFYNPSLFSTMFGDEPEKPRDVTPLPEEMVVSAIPGWRCWNVPLFVDELRSMVSGNKWPSYKRMEAVCEQPTCNGLYCECGIHAFRELKTAETSYKDSSRLSNKIFGEVWLWGRVLECKNGYRAQFAYPKSFVDTGTLARRMAEVYGVKAIEKPCVLAPG